MFEFLESQAMRLIEEITKTATGMDSDAEASLTQANQNEQEATQAEADATAEEGSCPHYKDVEHTETETDEDTGETHSVTVIERVADLAEDAASRARAASLRARAASLKSAAAALKALATALRAQLEAMKAQRQKFAEAVAEVNQKISDTTQKLGEGTSLIVGVISSFSVPIVSGAVNMVQNTANSILGNVGIDLSDGFDENDVYGLTGWIAKTTVDTGAFAVKTFISTTVASTLGGGMMGTTGAFAVGKVVGPTIDEAFGEKAVEGVHTFLTSALEFLGIKAKPDEKETATAGTEEVETVLKGDKANINPGSAESSKLSPKELAAEIWSGKWGNGADRKAALKEAGYSDDEIKAAQGVINTVYLGNKSGVKGNTGKSSNSNSSASSVGNQSPKAPGAKGNEGANVATSRREKIDAAQESEKNKIENLAQQYWNSVVPNFNDGKITEAQKKAAQEALGEMVEDYNNKYGGGLNLNQPKNSTGNSSARANAQRQIDNYWEYTYKEYQNGEISQEELSAQHDAVQKVVDQYYHNHPKAKKLNNENNPPKGGKK